MLRESKETAALAVVITLALACGPVVAFGEQEDSADMATQDRIACAEMSNPEEQLACFDTAVENLSAPAQTANPEPESNASDRRAGLIEAYEAPSVSESQSLYRHTEELQFAMLTPFKATVVSVRIYSDGRFSVELDNGDVWRETEGSKVRTPKPGDSVEVRKGAGSGYRMKVDGIPRVAWVRLMK